MKQIIVVKPNTLTEEVKKDLKENECIVIEHDNPSEIRVIRSTEGFEGDDLLQCLIGAIELNPLSTVRTDFAKLLLSKIKSKSEK